VVRVDDRMERPFHMGWNIDSSSPWCRLLMCQVAASKMFRSSLQLGLLSRRHPIVGIPLDCICFKKSLCLDLHQNGLASSQSMPTFTPVDDRSSFANSIHIQCKRLT
jgi:hypothetical protein